MQNIVCPTIGVHCRNGRQFIPIPSGGSFQLCHKLRVLNVNGQLTNKNEMARIVNARVKYRASSRLAKGEHNGIDAG